MFLAQNSAGYITNPFGGLLGVHGVAPTS